MASEPSPLATARVLGVLVEKQRTVPDTYPLSLNALVAGCNQKTSRDPIMELTDAEVQSTVDSLRARLAGDRVERRARHALRAQPRARAGPAGAGGRAAGGADAARSPDRR
jgi:uncharacterized protein YceH (UPF0502 family)